MKALLFPFSAGLLLYFFGGFSFSDAAGESSPQPPAPRSIPADSRPAPKLQASTRNGAHVLVGGSFRRKETAEELCRKVREKGEKASLQQVTDASKTVWHRVLIGPYATRQEAMAKAQFLEKQGLLHSFLVISPRSEPSAPTVAPVAYPRLTDIRVRHRQGVTRIFFQMEEKSFPQLQVKEDRDGPVLEILLPLNSSSPLAGRIHGETLSFRSIRCDALSRTPPQTRIRVFLNPGQAYDVQQEYFEPDKTLVVSLRLE